MFPKLYTPANIPANTPPNTPTNTPTNTETKRKRKKKIKTKIHTPTTIPTNIPTTTTTTTTPTPTTITKKNIKTNITIDTTLDTTLDTEIESLKNQSFRKYNLCIKRINQSKMNYAPFSLKLSKYGNNIQPPYVNLYKKHVNEFDIYDQGDIGSCTANALCSAYQFITPSHDGSRLFLYYNERMIDININEDNGATLSSGIKSLQTHGLCLESVWPYLEYNIYTKPPDYCYKQALKDKAIQCYNLPHDIYVMKECLLTGFPFVVGIAVFDDFENSKTGIIKLPKHNDIMIGGHAVLVCGYNDSKKHWIVRNSWGTSWGDNGYCYIPYEYLLNRRLSTELWCITKTKKI